MKLAAIFISCIVASPRGRSAVVQNEVEGATTKYFTTIENKTPIEDKTTAITLQTLSDDEEITDDIAEDMANFKAQLDSLDNEFMAMMDTLTDTELDELFLDLAQEIQNLDDEMARTENRP